MTEYPIVTGDHAYVAGVLNGRPLVELLSAGLHDECDEGYCLHGPVFYASDPMTEAEADAWVRDGWEGVARL